MTETVEGDGEGVLSSEECPEQSCPERSEGLRGDSVDDIATTLDPSSRNFQQTLKQQLLLRDDNRCIITGKFDRGKYALLSDTE